MIEAHDLLQKMGKRKFHDFVVGNQKGQTMAQMQSGIKGRIKFRMCQHGVVLLDNYEPKNICKPCIGVKSTKSKDFEPHFNAGLGAYVETKKEMLNLAKSKGMIHVGTDKR